METNEKNTYVEFELKNGKKVNMTLQFYRLYQLKNSKQRKSDYDRYNEINVKGAKEELDLVDMLYVAYLCANVENLDDCMDKREFLMNFPDNRKYVTDIYDSLAYPKKK